MASYAALTRTAKPSYFKRLRWCFIISDPLLELPETLGFSSEALNVRAGKSDLRRIGEIVWMLENKTKEILSIASQPALVINAMVFTAEAQ
jgi:hypothetical protein